MTVRFLIGMLMTGITAVACGDALGQQPGIVRVPNDGYAYDINASGTIVGYDSSASGNQAYRYTPGQAIVNMGGLSSGMESYAYAINAAGVIAGDSRNSRNVQTAFRYNGSMTALNPIGGTSSDYRSWARGINDSGVVVGYSQKNIYESYVTTWNGSSATNLGTVTGGENSFGVDISNTGYVTGHYETGTGISVRAFRKAPGGPMLSLGTLPGWGSTYAEAVNDSGVVVGYAFLANVTLEQAFKDVPGVGMVELKPLYSGGHTRAHDVNSLGVAVGSSWLEATLWQPDGTLVDLNAWLDTVNPTAGAQWDLSEARAINDAGMITGYGRFTNGSGQVTYAPYILDGSTLVPEPGVAGLCLISLLVGLRRQTRQVG